MWTHADIIWTDADCPQKCGQMWTIHADNTKTRSILRVMVPYSIPPIRQARTIFEEIKLALLSV